MELQTIPRDELEHVGGGNIITTGKRVYKWWTTSGKPSPKQVFDEVWNVGAKVGGAVAAGYYAVKHWWFGGGEKPEPIQE